MNNEANDNLTHHLSQHGFNGHDYGDFKDGWFASWQAATTALLEKLKSEGMVEKIAKVIHESVEEGKWEREQEGLHTTMMRDSARAVIEACILSIQGMESEQ